MKTFKVGITDFLRLIYRSGSIDSRIQSKTRMYLGTHYHKEINERQSRRKKDYQSEVPIEESFRYKNIEFIFTGRIDALYSEDGKPVIEEIKTTSEKELYSAKEVHRAQLLLYGLLFMQKNELERIKLRLNYFLISQQRSVFFNYEVTRGEAEEYVKNLIDHWLVLGELKYKWRDKRNRTIRKLPFIYPTFRKGQRELALSVFNTIRRNSKVLIEAPTGIGKTSAVLYPSIKSLLDVDSEQIFYLTAKTTIQKEAIKALNEMRKKGLKIKSTVITAKDKICLIKEETARQCNPDDCPYAIDFYDKLNEFLPELMKLQDEYSREFIEDFAMTYRLCPYHLSLELARMSDVIICDYNYLFDPVSRLQDEFQKRITLIDEAHNLPDRSRKMYSSSLSYQDLKNLLEAFPARRGRLKSRYKSLEKQTRNLIDFFHTLFSINEVVQLNGDILNDLVELLQEFQESSNLLLLQAKEKDIEIDQKFLKAHSIVQKSVFNIFTIVDYYDTLPELFSFYIKKDRSFTIHLSCLDASSFISSILKGNPSVLFSATLTPFEYYKQVLLSERDVPTIAIPSPFKRSNYGVLCDTTIDTRYQNREKSYRQIAEVIYETVSLKTGHYLVFFPSYSYLNQVLREYLLIDPDKDSVIVQNPTMTDEERNRFISKFQKGRKKLVGFCVMGGVFSEGLDLPKDELIGTVIVSPGLPGVDYERNLLKDYYEEKLGSGFAYAYAYPGMNRVLQSAGRVIRTEEDKGIILLIDPRFKSPFYAGMIPRHLKPEYYSNLQSLKNRIRNFWSESQKPESQG